METRVADRDATPATTVVAYVSFWPVPPDMAAHVEQYETRTW